MAQKSSSISHTRGDESLRTTLFIAQLEIGMASRRLQKRIEAEAAERLDKPAAKKKATKKRATRKKAKTTRKRKTKTAERKKIFWGVFSGTLKEEGRFNYDEREKAEEKLAALRNRSTKKLYFIQPIKETLSESGAPVEEAAPDDDDLIDDTKAAAADSEDDDDDDDGEEE